MPKKGKPKCYSYCFSPFRCDHITDETYNSKVTMFYCDKHRKWYTRRDRVPVECINFKKGI